jgi:hypothetical protein
MKSRILFSDGKRIPYKALNVLSNPRDLAALYACVTYGLTSESLTPATIAHAPYLYAWYRIVWGDAIITSRKVPLCFKHMCVHKKTRIIKAAERFNGDLYTFVMYCKLVGRRVATITPSVPLCNPDTPLALGENTLRYKNIYEAMTAFHTYISVRYAIRIVSRKKQSIINKHGLYHMWIAWMESMGALYALGLTHLKSDRATTVITIGANWS